ncbi:hypothetical protein C8R43DRAFT_1038166 [Mycena crocata]|nr:hypothetical protein C8R43DRAFT_1038166 [Mycena crocata]
MYTVHAGLDVPVLRQITAGNLDCLKTLRLRLKNNQMDQPDEEWQSEEITTFEAAPQLREVHIEAWSATSYMLPMPWAQLARLSLSYNLPQVCLDILVRCKRLVSATVHTKQWAEVDAPGAAHTLAQLETLDVHMDVWSEGEHLAPFLRRLKVPALKTLTLCLDFTQVGDEEYYIEWLVPDFANFLVQCPKIERLSLEECIFAADMVDILQHIPSLTELVFYDSSGNDELFAALKYSDTNPVHLVPKLETLGLLHVDEELADSETIFIEMLQSRWWSDEELLLKPSKPSVECLKSVTLKCDPYAPKVFSDDFLKAVTDCKAQGFQLTKTCY